MLSTLPQRRLTHTGALDLMAAAVAKATAMGQPQCVAIVDEGCNLLAFVRMDGAKVLSERSSIKKAVTAASNRVPTGGIADGLETRLALATEGMVTNLKGGLPIVIDGQLIGGIGVGSGTGDQDREVANDALRAVGAATFD